MLLVERHQIHKNHKHYNEIDKLAFLSKHLYNATLYMYRQEYIFKGTCSNYIETQKHFQNTNQKDYRALPTKVAQQTMINVDHNIKSFIAALAAYNEDPSKFKAKPRLCKYKHKETGRAILIYTNQAISQKQLRLGTIALSGTNIRIKTEVKNPIEVRIIKSTDCYVVEIVYECEEPKQKLNQKNKSAIDLGLNNLATLTDNMGLHPVLFNGKPLKSMNHFYNKKKAELQSQLPKEKKTSKAIKKLSQKRNNKVDNYMHNASRKIINHLVSNDIGILVIGYNEGWKQEVNLGPKNNQNFVNVPFLKFVKQLEYKSILAGIKTIIIEESYTSKCSFLDLEEICKHEKYAGKRYNRLFKSKEGKIIHSDVNGSFNIMRKAFPNEFTTDGIQAVVVQSFRVMPF
jgi:IS605 OrfB family transposase